VVRSGKVLAEGRIGSVYCYRREGGFREGNCGKIGRAGNDDD
jgi:hypothetical protein